jgi:uncharacterized membrane protein (UPF0127 family)
MRLLAALVLIFTSACGPRSVAINDFRSTEITLPNGKKILAEIMHQEVDMMRGMMFRESLAADRGMLFIHGGPGKYAYWMYQVKIPLDMIWMDRSRNIVEIVNSAAPCVSKKNNECPQYGGNQMAMFVLELAGGEASKNRLQVGDKLYW